MTRFVPGGGHTDCLRENGCKAGTTHTMESLVPPVVSRDSQPGYWFGGVNHQPNLLFECEKSDQVVNPFVHLQVRVLKRVFIFLFAA